jgi:hypothetical protein
MTTKKAELPKHSAFVLQKNKNFLKSLHKIKKLITILT